MFNKPVGFSQTPLETYYKNQNANLAKSPPKESTLNKSPPKPFSPISTSLISGKPVTLKKNNPAGSTKKVESWASQQIYKTAQNTNSVLFSVCMKTVFSSIPSTWFFESTKKWPAASTLQTQEILKRNLLSNHRVLKETMFLHERTLNKSILRKLTKLAFEHIKQFVNSLSQERRVLLTSTRDVIIRTAIETNQRLDIQPFVAKHAPLFDLRDNVDNSKEKWVFQAYLLKELTSYPLKNHEFPLHSSDRLFFFIAQFIPHRFKEPHFLNKFFEECADPLVTSKILNPPEGSALEILMNHLERLSRFLGEESYPVLIEKVAKYIGAFQDELENQTPLTKELATFQREVWLKCGDLHYGAFIPLNRFQKFKDGWAFLKYMHALPRLYSHDDAIGMLNREFFQGRSEALATIIYKNWWFGQYRDRSDKQLSLAERVVDWHMHDALLKVPGKSVTKKEIIDSVEMLCREKSPSLPFNRVRAEQMFFSLSLKYTESLVDASMKRLVEEGREMTLPQVIDHVKSEIYNLSPPLPFSRSRVEKLYLKLNFKNL